MVILETRQPRFKALGVEIPATGPFDVPPKLL
jgi:hypothetical protein